MFQMPNVARGYCTRQHRENVSIITECPIEQPSPGKSQWSIQFKEEPKHPHKLGNRLMRECGVHPQKYVSKKFYENEKMIMVIGKLK